MGKDKLENGLWLKKNNYKVYYTNGDGFIDYSYAEKFYTTLPEISVYFHDSGMVACHNMPCPVCKTNHATFITSSGYFDVCGSCRKQGWCVTKKSIDKAWYEFWK